jgi:hypothetical protein
MHTPRALAPILLTACLALTACGGGSSPASSSAAGSAASASAGASTAASTPSAASSESSGASSPATSGGAVSASDKAFCDTFTGARERFTDSQGLPSSADIDKIKKFADDLEKTAPAEQRDNAKLLATYFRLIAGYASREGSAASAAADVQAQIAKIGPAIASLSVWAATHCRS